MSVISQSFSQVSSILKTRFQNRNSGQRVRFRLPPEVKNILLDFIDGKNTKPYGELVDMISGGELSDDDLAELLNVVEECVSLMEKKLNLFVEALLRINWVHRNDKIVKKFQCLLIDLLSAHNYYTKSVLEKLMPILKSVGNEDEWIDGVPTETELRLFNNVHDVLKVLLQVIPMSCDILLQVVTKHFPYLRRPAHEYECFIYNLLKIAEYQPHFRIDFLFLIVKRLVALDVVAPRTEVLQREEEEGVEMIVEDADMFVMDTVEVVSETHIRMKHPVANTLDISMMQMFKYLHSKCHDSDQVNWERTKHLYREVIAAFEQVILSTYATNHIQFLLFYLCSFKMVIAEGFLKFLWSKVVSPNVAPIMRQSSVMYMGSLLARASYITVSILKCAIAEMSTWIHTYIASQDGLECANSDVRVHAVFYTVCQSLFYVIAFRHNDLVHSKKNLTFLQNLNLTKIVTCRLNPLRVCTPVVVQNFAAVTRTYQLAYCYSVMEHNARYSMPVIHEDDKGGIITKNSWLDTFFPFDPFVLRRSAHFIEPIYNSYQKPDQENSNILDKENYSRNGKEVGKEEEEEDDFLTEHPSENVSANTFSPDIFTYSSSPGFKQL